MAKYTGRVTFSCPRRGTIVRKFIGPSSGEAVAKMFKPGLEYVAGPGCKIVSREIVREGGLGGAKRKKRRRKR